MNAVFDHIEQTRYLLSQIFESGFSSGRNVCAALGEHERTAAEVGLQGGAELLRDLGGKLTALAAGQIPPGGAARAYCNAVAYYNMVADMLVVETMSAKLT
jgi:hypothetical protein